MKTKQRRRETIADQVQTAIAESDEPEVRAEIKRLQAERQRIESEIAELLQHGSDTERMADAIESGKVPDSADYDRLRHLRQQAEAFGLAASRAERRRSQILAKVSVQHSAAFQAEHRKRTDAVASAMESLNQAIEGLGIVPNVIRGHGLQADPTHYPTPHLEELQRLRHRLNFMRGTFHELTQGNEHDAR